MEPDYKEIDRQKLLTYLKDKSEVTVEDLLTNADIEKLRLYPLLFELEQDNLIEVTDRKPLGAPAKLKLK